MVSMTTQIPAASQSEPSRLRFPGHGARLTALFVYGLPSLLIVLPLGSFLIYAFWSVENGKVVRGFTLKNFREFFTGPIYLDVFLSSLLLSLAVSLIALVLGYIVAYVVWRMEGRLKYFLLLVTILPLAMSYIVKIYAMRGILGFNGYLNWLLVSSGLLEAPSRLFIYNQKSVLITMAVIYLPYAIFPIFLSLERIPTSLLHAAADLGARPCQVFRHVVLSLSLPGSIVGALFVMVLSLGDFMTPQMVGGNQGFTFGSVVWSQFGMAYNWPLGVALAIVLLAASLAIVALAALVAKKARVK